MEQRIRNARRARHCWFALLFALTELWSLATAQLRYSISEGINEGTVVGNVAKDLGLDKSTLSDRK
uniref:Cadherin N-terminal domain-containing protein n=1 Tax=Poecilia mexicana TaxID=48701 RepID=A0A3B3X8E5_9TELE